MEKRLYRSNNRMLGGICAGIAEYFALDPTLVRIAYIVISLISMAFPGLLAYLILWVVIPPKP
ncbi:MAG: PspC domain-containing protein [Cyclobacteriaceae bacterium]|nr:PspC domain-containing protein [Cyclobacteriaceae bacterium]